MADRQFRMLNGLLTIRSTFNLSDFTTKLTKFPHVLQVLPVTFAWETLS